MRREHIKYFHSVKRNCFAIPLASTKSGTTRVRSGGDDRGETAHKEWREFFISLRYQVDDGLDMVSLRKHIKRANRLERVATGNQLFQITCQGWRIA